MQRKRIATGVSRPRNDGCREHGLARKGKDSSLTLRMTKGGNALPHSVLLRPQPKNCLPPLSPLALKVNHWYNRGKQTTIYGKEAHV